MGKEGDRKTAGGNAAIDAPLPPRIVQLMLVVMSLKSYQPRFAVPV